MELLLYRQRCNKKGHGIAYINWVQDNINKLPCHPEKCSIVYVKFSRIDHQPVPRHKIHPKKICAALWWLKIHNPLYADIQIDDDMLTMIEVEDLQPLYLNSGDINIPSEEPHTTEPTPTESETNVKTTEGEKDDLKLNLVFVHDSNSSNQTIDEQI